MKSWKSWKSWMITGAAAPIALTALTGSFRTVCLADSKTSEPAARPFERAEVRTVSLAAKEAAKEAPRRLVTVDYVNAEVNDVIRTLSAQSGVNVALNPNVKGQVTVHLRGKTVDEAMVVVANLAGLGAKKVSDTFVIAPRADMRQTLERLGAKRFVGIEHAKLQDAADLAQGAFPDLTARPQGRGVALTGADDDLESAERLLKQNDSVLPDDIHVVEKIALKHIKAAQAASALVKMEPGLSAEAAGSSIVLSGAKAKVEAGKRGVELIDVQAPPNADTRVYNLKYSTAPELALVLERSVPGIQVVAGPESMAIARPAFNPLTGQFAGGGSGTTSGSGSTSPSAGSTGAGAGGAGVGTNGGSGSGANGGPGVGAAINKNALTLLLTGNPADLDQAMKILALTDVPPAQVVIEAKVVETSPSLIEDIGVNWSWDPLKFIEAKPGSSSGGFADVTKHAGIGMFSRVPWSFTGVLAALITKGDAKLLANPNVTVVNDQDASVFIGDTLRFQSLAQSSPTTGNQFTVVEVPVGIVLLVHPRINGDGNVTLRVHPVVSTVTGLINGLPQTSSREAETTVRAKDGDTIVIGGLIRDEDIRTMEKIPLLGDLPLIGQLFRHTNRNHRRTEVMVVLTIKILK